MKNISILLPLIIMSLPSFSQSAARAGQYDRLLESSARRQRGGIIFLAGGAALAGAGILLINDGVNRQDAFDINGNGLSKGESEQLLGIVLTGIGIGCMGTSIPFFIGAHKAKKKAMRLSMKTQSSSLLYKTNFLHRPYAALALSIPLGR